MSKRLLVAVVILFAALFAFLTGFVIGCIAAGGSKVEEVLPSGALHWDEVLGNDGLPHYGRNF